MSITEKSKNYVFSKIHTIILQQQNIYVAQQF